MEGLRVPVGDQPPEVYWRRRVTVLAGLILLVIVVWFLATSPSEDPTETPPVTVPTVSPIPTNSPTPGLDLARPCTSDDVAISLVANPRVFGGGSLPFFEASIDHTGTTPCMLDTGADNSDLFIRSGSDEIYYASHCPDSSPINSTQFLLSDGASDIFTVTWPRQRSAADCAPNSGGLGNGTYRAILTLQGVASNEAVFELTD